MRKIKDILRLRHEAGLPYRGIANALNIGYGTVVDYLNRAQRAGLGWPVPEGLHERDLGRLLFPTQAVTGQRRFAELDFPAVCRELKRKGVIKLLLWQEYRQRNPDDGYSYAQFCHRYRVWLGCQQRSMRQLHRAGEKLFVDYCGGPTLPIVNPDTGEYRQAHVFVVVLGASNYTFACASWSQKQADWLNAHVKAFEFFGGVPELVVPDNLKSAVRKTHRYEPDINPSYQQMASHYQCVIVPARPYKPRDKAKAEVAVQIVERWIMARLRHQSFFTLASLNQAIRVLLDDLNQRPFKKLPGTRLSQSVVAICQRVNGWPVILAAAVRAPIAPVRSTCRRHIRRCMAGRRNASWTGPAISVPRRAKSSVACCSRNVIASKATAAFWRCWVMRRSMVASGSTRPVAVPC